jgi:LPXTG-motif cell wall-anchored protein
MHSILSAISRFAAALPAPRTGDLNMMILIAVILIAVFFMFIIVKKRHR